MSRTWKDSKDGARRDAPRRNISVRAVRRQHPDTRKLARALLELAMAELRAEQEAREQSRRRKPSKPAEPSEGEHA